MKRSTLFAAVVVLAGCGIAALASTGSASSACSYGLASSPSAIDLFGFNVDANGKRLAPIPREHADATDFGKANTMDSRATVPVIAISTQQPYNAVLTRKSTSSFEYIAWRHDGTQGSPRVTIYAIGFTAPGRPQLDQLIGGYDSHGMRSTKPLTT